MTTTTATPASFSSETLDAILTLSECATPQQIPRLVGYIPTLVSMAREARVTVGALHKTNRLEEENIRLAAELKAAQSELSQVDIAFGNRSALNDCKTRTDKVELACREAARNFDRARNAEVEVSRLKPMLDFVNTQLDEAKARATQAEELAGATQNPKVVPATKGQPGDIDGTLRYGKRGIEFFTTDGTAFKLYFAARSLGPTKAVG